MLFTLLPGSLFNRSEAKRRLLIHKYSPLSIARYSFIQLSELEQCRVKKTCPRFHTIAQDSNPGPLSRLCGALQQSHCATIPDVKYHLYYFSQVPFDFRPSTHCKSKQPGYIYKQYPDFALVHFFLLHMLLFTVFTVTNCTLNIISFLVCLPCPFTCIHGKWRLDVYWTSDSV